MRYLVTGIIDNKQYAYFTDWFDYDNHFSLDHNTIVFDLPSGLFTTDGTTWNEIGFDHL